MKQNLLLEPPVFSDESDTEPVSLLEAKNWLKIDVDDDDNLVTDIITAARQQCEHYLKISLIERTITARLINDLNNIELPYGPVDEVSEVKDADDNVIDTDNYTVRGVAFKTLDYTGISAVSVTVNGPSGCNNELTVTYTAGYAAEDVPKYFKNAILNQIAWLYEHRGDELSEELSPAAIIKLKPHRRVV